ncbi:MAG: aa3-type cytochrome c oxidase subunit IV [Alphaproteobacteria bacterium]|jgi:hypothetical protein
MPWILLSGVKRAKPRPKDGTPGGSRMHIDPKEGHPDMDYAEHMATYKMFCKFTLWSVIIIAVIMALMAYFLT